jgi:hypothetical protein
VAAILLDLADFAEIIDDVLPFARVRRVARHPFKPPPRFSTTQRLGSVNGTSFVSNVCLD